MKKPCLVFQREPFYQQCINWVYYPDPATCSLEPDPLESCRICVLLIHSGRVESKCLSQQLSCLETPPGYPHQTFYCSLITHLLASDCYILLINLKMPPIKHQPAQMVFLLLIKILQGPNILYEFHVWNKLCF